jgi:hypothetical protein
VKKPFLICAPADKDGSGIVDPATHICCYKIKGSKLDPPESVEIEDQWGTLQLEVKKPKSRRPSSLEDDKRIRSYRVPRLRSQRLEGPK